MFMSSDSKEKKDSTTKTTASPKVEEKKVDKLVFKRVWREGRAKNGLVLYVDVFGESYRLFPYGYGGEELSITEDQLESLSKEPVTHPNVKDKDFQHYLWQRGAVLNTNVSPKRLAELNDMFEKNKRGKKNA